MPALTTSQLHRTHSQYLDASDITPQAFRFALNEIMPRIYKMGFWREMMVEHTQEASSGYVSLPPDTDAVIAGILDNDPLPTRSLWHDYKLFGTNDQDTTTLNAFIDDGYAPTYRDLDSANKYKIRIVSLKAPYTALSTEGKITFKFRKYNDAASLGEVPPNTVLKGASYNETTIDFSDHINFTPGDGSDYEFFDLLVNANEILEINWAGLNQDHPIRIIGRYNGDASAAGNVVDDTKNIQLADIDTAYGSSLYRRFRVGNTNSDSMAHMLLKRRWIDCDSDSDLVHIPSNAILKHALLGKLSEDNADAQRAMYHWGVVKELLEADTDSQRGAAKPTLHIAPDGVGAGMSGMY